MLFSVYFASRYEILVSPFNTILLLLLYVFFIKSGLGGVIMVRRHHHCLSCVKEKSVQTSSITINDSAISHNSPPSYQQMELTPTRRLHHDIRIKNKLVKIRGASFKKIPPYPVLSPQRSRTAPFTEEEEEAARRSAYVSPFPKDVSSLSYFYTLLIMITFLFDYLVYRSRPTMDFLTLRKRRSCQHPLSQQ